MERVTCDTLLMSRIKEIGDELHESQKVLPGRGDDLELFMGSPKFVPIDIYLILNPSETIVPSTMVRVPFSTISPLMAL